MQTATSILPGCELRNPSGLLAWTTPPAESSPPAGCAAALISWLGYSDVTQARPEGERTRGWKEFSSPFWEGASLLSKEAMGRVKAWPVASAKLLVWALTCYAISLPKFRNLHLVCWTGRAKKKRPWKGWCTAFWHFPHAAFWFLRLKRVFTKSTPVCFLNV